MCGYHIEHTTVKQFLSQIAYIHTAILNGNTNRNWLLHKLDKVSISPAHIEMICYKAMHFVIARELSTFTCRYSQFCHQSPRMSTTSNSIDLQLERRRSQHFIHHMEVALPSLSIRWEIVIKSIQWIMGKWFRVSSFILLSLENNISERN